MKAILIALALLCPMLYADHLEIPAGAEVEIRTNEMIDSSATRSGQVFSASVNRNVTDGAGNVVIPTGAPAQLVIRSQSTGGKLGSGELLLDLESVQVDGRSYHVSATDLERKAKKRGLGKNERTAKMAGGGAALGAVIGGIAGGGSGAVIGAIAGAGAGAAAQVLTRGKDVRVPAESTLTFRLDQPLRLATR